MVPTKVGYWALISAAVAVAAIGVMMLVWGLKLNTQLASAYADRLMVGGIAFMAAGGLGARWLLERGQ